MNGQSFEGGRSLIRSVWSHGVSDIISQGTELCLDSALDEGLLRDIPVFGWIAKTYGLLNTIRERIFLQKIFRFLQEAQATTDAERRDFAERMEADPVYESKVGEALFLLLDRHENVEKSVLLGRVFAAFVRNEISDEEFQRYSFIIDRLFLPDLINLSQHYGKITEFEELRKRGKKIGLGQFLDEKTIQALFGNGLLDSDGYVETTYHRNSLGEKLIRLIRPENDDL